MGPQRGVTQPMVDNRSKRYVKEMCIPMEVAFLILETVGPTCTYTLPAVSWKGIDSGDLDAAGIGYEAPSGIAA